MLCLRVGDGSKRSGGSGSCGGGGGRIELASRCPPNAPCAHRQPLRCRFRKDLFDGIDKNDRPQKKKEVAQALAEAREAIAKVKAKLNGLPKPQKEKKEKKKKK